MRRDEWISIHLVSDAFSLSLFLVIQVWQSFSVDESMDLIYATEDPDT